MRRLTPVASERRLMVLDSASMYFRAFHGVPDTFRAPDGSLVNAVRGFLDMTATLLRLHPPRRVVEFVGYLLFVVLFLETMDSCRNGTAS